MYTKKNNVKRFFLSLFKIFDNKKNVKICKITIINGSNLNVDINMKGEKLKYNKLLS